MEDHNEKRTRIGITILPEAVRTADNNVKPANCKSRSEFIERAILHYAGYLAMRDNTDYIAKAIAQTMRGIIKSGEDRIARMQFKDAVELAKIVRMIAPLCEIGGDELRRLHIDCVDEVKHINGIIRADAVLRDG
jgi:hypothetical protein